MPTNSPQLDEYKYQAEQRVKNLKECFGTASGSVTLKTLKAEFFDCEIQPGDNNQFQLGQRDVIYQILTIMGEI